MVFYGTNGTHLRTEPLPGAACPNCASPDTLKASVFSRYFHLYWVPVFPYSKPTVLHCAHCGADWEGKAITPELQPLVRSLKQETRAPWWHWVGLVLIGLGLAWGITSSARNSKEDEVFLKAPQAGDIYTVRDDENATDYSLLKVVSAKGNTVEVVANEYQINNNQPIKELNAPAKYSKDSFSLTLLELQIMRNKGQLTDIDRLGAD